MEVWWFEKGACINEWIRQVGVLKYSRKVLYKNQSIYHVLCLGLSRFWYCLLWPNISILVFTVQKTLFGLKSHVLWCVQIELYAPKMLPHAFSKSFSNCTVVNISSPSEASKFWDVAFRFFANRWGPLSEFARMSMLGSISNCTACFPVVHNLSHCRLIALELFGNDHIIISISLHCFSVNVVQSP